MVCRAVRCPEGSSYRWWSNACRIWSVKLGMMFHDLAFGPKLHDPYVFGSLEVKKTGSDKLLSHQKVRNRSGLLEPKQGKRDVHSLHTAYMAPYELHYNKFTVWTWNDYSVYARSCGCPILTYLCRLQLNTLEDSISIVEKGTSAWNVLMIYGISPTQANLSGCLEYMELWLLMSDKHHSPNF